MWRLPLLFMASQHQKYFNTEDNGIAFKNAFPVAFNYSEICDYSVFNLNHYLLLSYSRMINQKKT